jgi:hypothetical protein
LRDLAATVRVAADGGIGLWLHGHRHHPYFVANPPTAPFPIICAGSATQMGIESYGEYEISAQRLVGRRRVYDQAAAAFRDGEVFEMELKN